MLHHGTVVWLIAASARTPQRITALLSAASPTWKPGQSTRCTIGRWKVCAMSTKRMILLHASAVQPPEAGDDRPAEQPPHLEETALVDQRLDNTAHVIGLLLLPRHRTDQEL